METPEVTELHPVPDAHVPVMKFKFRGISIDLLYAQLSLWVVPEVRTTSVLMNLDEDLDLVGVRDVMCSPPDCLCVIFTWITDSFRVLPIRGSSEKYVCSVSRNLKVSVRWESV